MDIEKYDFGIETGVEKVGIVSLTKSRKPVYLYVPLCLHFEAGLTFVIVIEEVKARVQRW